MSYHGGFPHHGDPSGRGARPRPGVLPGPDRARGRYTWRYLDTDDAARLWDEVTDWVWWLRDRYELTERIPRCWYRHGPVVEEFTAVFASWSEAYGGESGLSRWHSQDLWPLIERLEVIAGFEQCQADGCSHDSGFLHAPEGTEAVMEPLVDPSGRDADEPVSTVDAMVVGVVDESVMLSAVVSGEATALDAGLPHGRYRLDGRLWTWSSILGGYVPSRDTHRTLRALES
ncbi:hypothetical protein [Rhodococcus sp. UNC23MFCrub1.1]|uniref:hypothetical protein n=1 Tax=Rhodococcus sp. UNC23MFCrub1.1 TaxID=1449068 RepID=UPI00068F3086|nr:hypothetical protein [Rhodococcus sp. UNC23MFCrub1.1]